MKKIIIIVIILFITGCTTYNELNNLAIIKSIGIEVKDNKYTLYAQIIDEIDKNNNPKTQIIMEEGDNIQELFQNIKIHINKEIYLAHIDLLILNKIDNTILNNIINYFLNNQSFRNDFLTILSDNINDILEKTKYDEIEKIITTNKDTKKIIKISFEEIIQNYLDKKEFSLSKINYQNKINFEGNYKFLNNKLERINNEKNRT